MMTDAELNELTNIARDDVLSQQQALKLVREIRELQHAQDALTGAWMSAIRYGGSKVPNRENETYQIEIPTKNDVRVGGDQVTITKTPTGTLLHIYMRRIGP